MRLDEIDQKKIEDYLKNQINQIIENYEIIIDDISKNKIKQ